MRVRTYRHNGNTIVIAPRRSGKTENLINSAISHAEQDIHNYSVVVAHSFHEARRLQVMTRQRIGHTTEKIKFFSISNIGKNTSLWRNINPHFFTKFYFDEFEQMDNRLPVNLEYAYYVSSPRMRYEQSQTFRLMDNWGVEGIHFSRHYDDLFEHARRNMFMTDEQIQNLTDNIIETAVREIQSDDAESDDSYLYRLGV